MGDRTAVKSQSFFRLLEVAADNVSEVLDVDLQIRIERIDIVDRYFAYSIHISPQLRLLVFSPRAMLLGEKIFNIVFLLLQKRLQVVHCLVQFHHGA